MTLTEADKGHAPPKSLGSAQVIIVLVLFGALAPRLIETGVSMGLTLQATERPMDVATLTNEFAAVVLGNFLVFICGILSDRWLGYRASLLIAGLLLTISCGLLAISHATLVVYPAVFISGLAGPWLTCTSLALLAVHSDRTGPDRDDLFVLYFITSAVAEFSVIFFRILLGILADRWTSWTVTAKIMIPTLLIASSVVLLAVIMYRRWTPLYSSPASANDQLASPRPSRWILWFLASILALRAAAILIPNLENYWLSDYLDSEYHRPKTVLPIAHVASLGTAIGAPLLLLLVVRRLRRGKGLSASARAAIGILLAGSPYAMLLIVRLLGGDSELRSAPWLLASTFVWLAGISIVSSATLALAARLIPRRFLATLFGFAVLRVHWLERLDMRWTQWPPIERLAILAAVPFLVCGLFLLAARRGLTEPK